MKLDHHTNPLTGEMPVWIVSTLDIVPGSRIGRIVTGQWPVVIDALSASHDQWIVGILNGWIGMVQRDTTHCRKCGEVLPQRSHWHRNRCRYVRSNPSTCLPKAGWWRQSPPDLRGKYGYPNTIVLHFVRRLDFETHLAKGNPFGIPDFGGNDLDKTDHDPSGHSPWMKAVAEANMNHHDERSWCERTIDRECCGIRTRSIPICYRINFESFCNHSVFVFDLFAIHLRFTHVTQLSL